MKEKILKALRSSDIPVSGERLSKELHITRAMVHKHMKALKDLGYSIDSKSGAGYVLHRDDLMNQYEMQEIIDSLGLNLSAYYYDSTDSTNTRAKALEPEALLVAAEQTEGRGRRGRSWISHQGSGLYFSLLLRPELSPDKLRLVTLFFGLMLAESLGDRAKIKWPNDIYLGERKLAGILTELVSELDVMEKLIVGIGINLEPLEEMPTATSLSEEGLMLTKKELLKKFLKQYSSHFKTFQEAGLEPFLEALRSRDFLLGREVGIANDADPYIYHGIDEIGRAILERSDKTIAVESGELSLGWR